MNTYATVYAIGEAEAETSPIKKVMLIDRHIIEKFWSLSTKDR